MTSIMQLVLFALGLLLFGFGLFVGIYPEGDQTDGVLIMLDAHAKIIYNYEVRKLNYSRQDILEDLVKLKTDINPDLVFLPSSLVGEY